MAKKTLGGAVIGYGGMGGFHTKKMIEVDGIELIGVYDIDPERHKVAAERGIKYYDTREELLSDENIDVVVVATPNDFHEEIVIAALNAGKNVVSEKPVTMTTESLERMIAAAEKNGKIFTVHQNRRFDSDYLVIRKIIEQNSLGNIYRFESRVQGSRGIPSGWRGEKEHGGGMLLDWGVHMLDQMLDVMRDVRLLTVYASMTYVTNAECDDGFTAIFRFENGVEWIIEINTNNFISLPRWYVLGENGSALIEDWDLNGKIVKVMDFEKYDVAPVVAGAGITKTMAPRNDDTIKEFDLPKDGVETGWSSYYHNLVAALNGEETILVTHDQQRRLVKLIEAVFESAAKNELVHFE